MVIYHGNCLDGFCSAWLISRFCHLPANTIYYAAKHGSPPPHVDGHDVLMFDFAYPREILEEMHSKANSLLVFDHHKTNEADLRGLDYCRFDMNRSGAGMASDYVQPPMAARILAGYVEDRDLWLWRSDNSKAVNEYISSFPMEFKVWDKISIDIDERLPLVIAEGEAIMRRRDQMVAELCKNAVLCDVDNRAVLAVNSPILQSEIGHELAKKGEFGVVWSRAKDGAYIHSLRSIEGGADVSEIAKKFGGGGHKHAAGFASNRPPVIL